MLADVGLIGFPNVGKSSILSRISAARPKIADYHFTTLSPNLGVVKTGDERGFVAADIPGLIEGAADGAGLGHDFLRHVERCRLLLHVVDISGCEGRDPIEDIRQINRELALYSPALAERPQIIVANKFDAHSDETVDLDAFEAYVDELGCELVYVSAVSGKNLEDMVQMVEERLRLLPPLTIYASEIDAAEQAVGMSGERKTEIRVEDGVYVVEGEWLYNLLGQVNFADYESLAFFQRVLQKGGVIAELEQAGAVDGDSVRIYDFEFDFIK